MTFADQTPNSTARLIAWLRRVEERVTALEDRGLVIPVLDADPGPDDPTNLWLLNDGRLRARDAEGRLREWVPTVDTRPQVPTFAATPAVSTGWRMWTRGSDGALVVRLANDSGKVYSAVTAGGGADGGSGSQGGGGSSDPKPPRQRSHVHRQTWNASGSASFCPVHGKEPANNYYGRWSSTHGERRVMYTLPDGPIRAALAGAGIRKVELRVRNLHAFSNSGMRIHWGAHNEGVMPNAFHQRYRNVWTDHWPKVGYGGGRDNWHVMPDWFGRALRDNKIKGLTIDQPSGSVGFYGLIHPNLDLRITYTHKH